MTEEGVMRFMEFMNGTVGRTLRIVLGLAMIGAGLWAGGVAGWVLAIVGFVPLAAGTFDFCLLAPFFHAPMRAHHA